LAFEGLLETNLLCGPVEEQEVFISGLPRNLCFLSGRAAVYLFGLPAPPDFLHFYGGRPCCFLVELYLEGTITVVEAREVSVEFHFQLAGRGGKSVEERLVAHLQRGWVHGFRTFLLKCLL
jgi:hypothetical protein